MGRRFRQRQEALARRHDLVRGHRLRVLSDPVTTPRQIRLTVEYDGTGLAGWQRQANAPTVQEHLETALARVLDHPVTITGASRTDAGVHAYGQVACVSTERTIPVHGVRRGINSILPTSIAVVDAREVPSDFHPRFSATGKHYRYLLLARPDRSPILATRAWHRPLPLDLAAMREAATAFPGERDFAALRAAGCTARTTVRNIEEVTLSSPESGAPGLVAVDVRGNAFLRNMVRILVGTLVDVGEGRLRAAQIPEILASRDRTRAGQTAPPQGLYLVSVRYAPDV
ncbi:MAG TPA: tRNA pseudouridine(38-40) synthase TruA [Kofleriaceae bacterium]|nr:tRNA pseudouridine(38-40) synthase TruA [Kofleriaceae bacterium]